MTCDGRADYGLGLNATGDQRVNSGEFALQNWIWIQLWVTCYMSQIQIQIQIQIALQNWIWIQLWVTCACVCVQLEGVHPERIWLMLKRECWCKCCKETKIKRHKKGALASVWDRCCLLGECHWMLPLVTTNPSRQTWPRTCITDDRYGWRLGELWICARVVLQSCRKNCPQTSCCAIICAILILSL